MGPYEFTPLSRRCFSYLVFWFKALKRLSRTTLVYARAHPANLPIAIAAWLMRIPVVQEINGSYLDVSITHAWLSRFNREIAILYCFQYRKANHLVAVTPELADWARSEAPGVPVHTNANGANCEIFNPLRPPARSVGQDYALFFGSLTRWHGIETIISSIEDPAWPPDLDLVIIGDGQLSPIVRQAADQNAHIHAFPSAPQETIAGYITGATVGLVPINTVGGRGRFGLSPLKLYEMLACGLPVVVTDFPGQAELVRSLDAGLIIPPDDPSALAHAVATLRHAPPSRAKMLEVASVIKTKHSWSNRVAKLNIIIESTIKESRP